MNRLAVLLAASLATACSDPNYLEGPEGICGQVGKDIPIEINRDLDLLFVIGNSATMAEEQASLRTNFGRFISVLENIEGGLPNVHIGVISTDVGAGGSTALGCSGSGDNGALQSTPRSAGCAGPSGAFIQDIGLADGSRTRNYTGSLEDTFACIAELGTNGCGFSQPLEAVRRALDGSNPANTGFLRENAFLMVVILTDKDDCSATPGGALFDPNDTALGPLTSFRCFEYGVQCDPDTPRTPGTKSSCTSRAGSTLLEAPATYAQFLKNLKPDPSMVIISVVMGNDTPVVVGLDGGDPVLEPSCQTASGAATPGIRLAELADQFPQRNTLISICNDDLSDALILLAGLHATTLGSPCIEGDIDLDHDTDGIQHECVVSDIYRPGTEEQTETLIPECASDNPQPGDYPCWLIAPDPLLCPDTPSTATIEVFRGPVTIPGGTYTSIRCSLGCDPPPL